MSNHTQIESLKAKNEEQREWGNHKVADLLAEDLQKLLEKVLV